MTNVIKGEFEKIKDVTVEDVSLTCDTPLEIFNMEVSRLSKMDNDLFTYEVEVANIPCNLKEDDDSEDVDDDMGGDDEVELTDENLLIMKMKLNGQHVVGRMVDTIIEETYLELTLLETNSIIRYEWYEALEDGELKDLALRNKASMEGLINDDDDESCYEQRIRWNEYTNYDDAYEINHEEYVAVKEDEYNDLTITRIEAYQAYQEIFRIMDEGWMVIKAE
nr:hypothetical protein [Tanacetum cinerariifolium]